MSAAEIGISGNTTISMASDRLMALRSAVGG
jgi:hypothetical protein